jgi:hypothetical protein
VNTIQGAYLERCSSLVRLGCKVLRETNTLAYLFRKKVKRKVLKIIEIRTEKLILCYSVENAVPGKTF